MYKQDRQKNSSKLGKSVAELLFEHDYNQAPQAEDNTNKTLQLLLTQIIPNKNQPRKHFEEESLQELARSIEKQGLLQPILVRPLGMRDEYLGGELYELVAGERRWRASKYLNAASIKCISIEVSDKQAFEIAVVENIQRESLNVIEEAQSYRNLIDYYSYTQQEVAEVVNKARSHVANMLRLLKLPKEVQEMLITDKINLSQAKAILSSSDPITIANKIVDEKLSVRQTEQIVQYYKQQHNEFSHNEFIHSEAPRYEFSTYDAAMQSKTQPSIQPNSQLFTEANTDQAQHNDIESVANDLTLNTQVVRLSLEEKRPNYQNDCELDNGFGNNRSDAHFIEEQQHPEINNLIRSLEDTLNLSITFDAKTLNLTIHFQQISDLNIFMRRLHLTNTQTPLA